MEPVQAAPEAVIESSSPSKAPYGGIGTYERALAELQVAMADSEQAYRRERAAAEDVLARGKALAEAGRDCCRTEIDVAGGAAEIRALQAEL